MCLDFVPKYIAGARPCERWPSPIGCIWMHVLCVSHVASCTRLTNSVKLLIASSTFRLVVHSLHLLMFRPRPHHNLRRNLQIRVCHTHWQSLRALDHHPLQYIVRLLIQQSLRFSFDGAECTKMIVVGTCYGKHVAFVFASRDNPRLWGVSTEDEHMLFNAANIIVLSVNWQYCCIAII